MEYYQTGVYSPAGEVRGTIGGEPYLDKPALIFEVGTTKDGRKVTPEMLDKIMGGWVRPANEIDWTVPIQLSHSTDSSGSVGNVRELWRDGNQIWATARAIGDEAVRKVASGVWRKLSVGLNDDGTLGELTITPFPAVLTAQFFENQPNNETEDSMTNPPAGSPATTPAVEPAAVPPTNFASLEAMKAQFEAKTEAMKAQFEAQQAQMKQQLESQGAQLEAQQKALKFAARTALVDRYSTEGRTVPAMREAELALLETLDDNQLAKYEALKAVQPVIAHLQAFGSATMIEPVSATTVAEDEQVVNEMLGLSQAQKGGK